ncbi:hypothetical protein D3C72_1055350 [compost metagenome]
MGDARRRKALRVVVVHHVGRRHLGQVDADIAVFGESRAMVGGDVLRRRCGRESLVDALARLQECEQVRVVPHRALRGSRMGVQPFQIGLLVVGRIVLAGLCLAVALELEPRLALGLRTPVQRRQCLAGLVLFALRRRDAAIRETPDRTAAEHDVVLASRAVERMALVDRRMLRAERGRGLRVRRLSVQQLRNLPALEDDQVALHREVAG